MPGEACPWKKTWSPAPPSSLPRKKWLKPVSYSDAEDAYVERWPPRPSEAALARRTMTTALQQRPGSGRTAETDDISDGLCPFLRFPRVNIGWPPDALLQCTGIHLLSPPNPLGAGGQLLVPLRQGHEELTFEGAGAG